MEYNATFMYDRVREVRQRVLQVKFRLRFSVTLELFMWRPEFFLKTLLELVGVLVPIFVVARKLIMGY